MGVGYDKNGFNKGGIHKSTLSRFDTKGFDINGYDLYGKKKDRFNVDGLSIETKINKKANSLFDEKGYDINGFDKEGFGKRGFDKDGFNKKGFNKQGYDWNGFNKNGLHRLTKSLYDKDGYDKNRFNNDGINKFTLDTFDTKGFDKNGYNHEGFNRKGLDKDGFNYDGWNTETKINKITNSLFDEEGYDINGFDEKGYDINGLNESGSKKQPIEPVDDELLYEYVMEEMEQEPNLVKGLWAKAIALSEGDKNKAKSLYMQYRVQAIKHHFQSLEIDYNKLSREQLWETINKSFNDKEKRQTTIPEDQEQTTIPEEEKVANDSQDIGFIWWNLWAWLGLTIGNLQTLALLIELELVDWAVLLIGIYTVLLIMVLKYNKYAFLIATIISLNPLYWIINGIYLKNRWDHPKVN